MSPIKEEKNYLPPLCLQLFKVSQHCLERGVVLEKIWRTYDLLANCSEGCSHGRTLNNLKFTVHQQAPLLQHRSCLSLKLGWDDEISKTTPKHLLESWSSWAFEPKREPTTHAIDPVRRVLIWQTTRFAKIQHSIDLRLNMAQRKLISFIARLNYLKNRWQKPEKPCGGRRCFHSKVLTRRKHFWAALSRQLVSFQTVTRRRLQNARPPWISQLVSQKTSWNSISELLVSTYFTT